MRGLRIIITETRLAFLWRVLEEHLVAVLKWHDRIEILVIVLRGLGPHQMLYFGEACHHVQVWTATPNYLRRCNLVLLTESHRRLFIHYLSGGGRLSHCGARCWWVFLLFCCDVAVLSWVCVVAAARGSLPQQLSERTEFGAFTSCTLVLVICCCHLRDRLSTPADWMIHIVLTYRLQTFLVMLVSNYIHDWGLRMFLMMHNWINKATCVK